MRKRREDTTTATAQTHGEDELQPVKALASATVATTASGPDASAAIVTTAAPAALAALVLGVYAKTLYPTVAGGDSGELVAESCHLGVSHPPGYPLFNMAVHAFALLLPWDHSGPDGAPAMTVAWRANLFSAGTTRATVVAIVVYGSHAH